MNNVDFERIKTKKIRYEQSKHKISRVALSSYEKDFELTFTHNSTAIEGNTLTLIESGKISYVISTSSKGRIPSRDSVKIRRKTVERSICCLTAIDTANAVADILAMGKEIDDIEMVDITKI